jgi:hypothetical protein
LAWNLEIHMRLGYFGLTMVRKKALRSGKGTQIKGQVMAKLLHADLFVQMRVIDCKTKDII